MKKVLFYSIILGFCTVAVSPDSRAQWVPTDTSTGGYIEALAAVGTDLFAGGSGVFRSTNRGTSWTPIKINSMYTGANCLSVIGSDLFAASDVAFISTDNGSSWTEADSGLDLSQDGCHSVALVGETLIAGIWPLYINHQHIGGGAFRSADYGKHWTASGLANTTIFSLIVSRGNLYAGTDMGVYLSTDTGTTWQPVNSGLPQTPWATCLAVSGSNVFAGVENLASTTSGSGIYRSTDSGGHWNVTSPWGQNVLPNNILAIGSNLFVGTSQGLIASTDNGASWTGYWDGLTDQHILSQAICGDDLYVGTEVGVSRRPLSEMIPTGVLLRDLRPVTFSLSQNYPNPFNPTTTIRFALAQRLHVTLSVFNTLGQQVATLVNETQDAGYHELRFDGTRLASGVYFFRLQAGSFVDTKKLVILR